MRPVLACGPFALPPVRLIGWFDHRLFSASSVGVNLQTADEQGRQDILGIVVHPDTHPSTMRRNVGMIRCWYLVLSSVGSMNNKRQERLRCKSLANIVRHGNILAEPSLRYNPGFSRPTFTFT